MSADIIQFPNADPMVGMMRTFATKMEAIREDERNDPLLAEARACLRRLPKASPDRLTKNEVAQLREILRQYNTVAGGSYLLKHHMVEGRD